MLLEQMDLQMWKFHFRVPGWQAAMKQIVLGCFNRAESCINILVSEHSLLFQGKLFRRWKITRALRRWSGWFGLLMKKRHLNWMNFSKFATKTIVFLDEFVSIYFKEEMTHFFRKLYCCCCCSLIGLIFNSLEQIRIFLD